jgi:hypothetical protein
VCTHHLIGDCKNTDAKIGVMFEKRRQSGSIDSKKRCATGLCEESNGTGQFVKSVCLVTNAIYDTCWLVMRSAATDGN